MSTTPFRRITLNRIGSGLFVVGILLLVGGAAGLILHEVSGGSARLLVVGGTWGQVLLLGVTSLVFSTVIFGLAIIQERLARIEAKLDAAIQIRALEEQSTSN
jgi:hypothetical protein